jgi:hypothetical protein
MITGSQNGRSRYIVNYGNGRREWEMRGIAKLIFGDGFDNGQGDGDGGLLGLFGAGDGDAAGAAERVRKAREWCGGTPSAATAVPSVTRASRFIPRRGDISL